MEKIWIKKELYFEKYEFLKFYTIFSIFILFLIEFLSIFLVRKIAKKENVPVELTWRALADVASGPTWRAGPPRRYDAALRPCGRTRVAHAGR